MAEIPQTVQQFVVQYLHSLSELEILLLLRDRSAEYLDADAVGKALMLHGPAVDPRLESLRSSGLIEATQEKDRRVYRYAAPPAQATVIDELVEWYKTHPVAITTLIFSKPIDKIRTFAKSFRLRKEEDE